MKANAAVKAFLLQRFFLNFRNCLFIKENKTDFELRIRSHSRNDWIERVLAHPADKGNKILVADLHEIANYNDKHPNQPLKILEERIMRINEWFSVKGHSNNFMIPLYSKMTLRLRENGLLDRIIAKWFDLQSVRPPPLESDPVVLTFDHVGFTFYISGAFLIVATIVFVLEIMFEKLKISLKRKFINRYL